MSVARGFGINGKSYYTNVAKPMDVNLNFIVDSSNANGYGIRSLKSNGYVESVFMHTSATPGVINGYTNPNPAVGFAQIRFKNNFNYFLGSFGGFVTPVDVDTGTTVAGDVYTITVLGTTTAAQWAAAGLPIGFTAAVGATFVATASGLIGGTGKVALSKAPTIQAVTVVGNANKTLNNSNIATNAGAVIIVGFYAPTSSSVTTLIPAAPDNNSVVGMNFRFDGSSVTVDGI